MPLEEFERAILGLSGYRADPWAQGFVGHVEHAPPIQAWPRYSEEPHREYVAELEEMIDQLLAETAGAAPVGPDAVA
jgi:hypothetical protein